MNKEFNMPEESEPEGLQPEELRTQPHLEVYEKHFILTDAANNIVKLWSQGKQSKEAQERYKKVQEALEQDFFQQKIEEARLPEVAEQLETRLSEVHKKAIEEIIGAVTDQAGRALVDILILQLVVKVICPEQDIRLHKANNNPSAFSWTEGISMRSLDSGHIIPTLRAYDLLRINQYGGYMTRSFAENYPYTLFYKAEIRGAKRQGKQRWLEIIDDLENGKLDAQTALLYVLQLLWKYSEAFSNLTQRTLKGLQAWLSKQESLSLHRATGLIAQHFEKSETKARLLEVAIHAFLQALNDLGIDLGGALRGHHIFSGKTYANEDQARRTPHLTTLKPSSEVALVRSGRSCPCGGICFIFHWKSPVRFICSHPRGERCSRYSSLTSTPWFLRVSTASARYTVFQRIMAATTRFSPLAR
jgi:hypothetical protein